MAQQRDTKKVSELIDEAWRQLGVAEETLLAAASDPAFEFIGPEARHDVWMACCIAPRAREQLRRHRIVR